MTSRRAAGGGRNKLGGTALSRLRFECQVPTCKASFRSDNLKTHYINCVQFDAKGLPIDLESVEFERLNEKKKDHTRFFAKNGYCLQKLPSHGKATVTENSVRGYFTRIGEAGNSTSKDSCEGPSNKKPRLDEEEGETSGDIDNNNKSSEGLERIVMMNYKDYKNHIKN